ncbi:MAG TPA: AmmeMemoRadiSam system protein B, partial [Blastocatellia bacterium]|nr:AmmeMemoRadiSam system protein B [Blastocatellia bacterium]
PQALLPVLALCDGTREDARELRVSFELRFGVNIKQSTIEELLAALNETTLLANDRYAEVCGQALREYRESAYRSSALAGTSYPADPDELRAMLDSFRSIPGEPVKTAGSSEQLALVSPHIDYARGGKVYAEVWMTSAEMVRGADLVVVFGTDHYGGVGELTLTCQNYATPLGVLPTATGIVEELAEAIGTEAAFAGELRHRGEHSIELATVWLQHARQGSECEIVPILCGSFASFIRGDKDERSDATIHAVVEVLRMRASGRRVLYVAAADLAHVGPAFGGDPVDSAGRDRLKESDDELIERICAGDPGGFMNAIKRVQDCNNVCGVSPIYMMLRMIAGSRGAQAGYDRCPADEDGTSLVSICGVVFDGSA